MKIGWISLHITQPEDFLIEHKFLWFSFTFNAWLPSNHFPDTFGVKLCIFSFSQANTKLSTATVLDRDIF